jgi:hypothetical protein
MGSAKGIIIYIKSKQENKLERSAETNISNGLHRYNGKNNLRCVQYKRKEIGMQLERRREELEREKMKKEFRRLCRNAERKWGSKTDRRQTKKDRRVYNRHLTVDNTFNLVLNRG